MSSTRDLPVWGSTSVLARAVSWTFHGPVCQKQDEGCGGDVLRPT